MLFESDKFKKKRYLLVNANSVYNWWTEFGLTKRNSSQFDTYDKYDTISSKFHIK